MDKAEMKMTKTKGFDLTEKQTKIKKRVTNTLVYFALGVWALFVLFPFYYMILTSLKSYGEYNAEAFPKLYTLTPTIENYIEAFRAVPLLDYLVNTLIFTVVTTALMLIITIPAAYAFARMNFPGKDIVFVAFLALMMLPQELVIITNYVTVTELDLRNTFAGLILPSVASIFYIYLLKENFSQIPNELYLAAKVDGTSDFKYMLKVMVPISKPTIITITILKVIECWNSYVWPRLVVDSRKYYLVSVGLQQLRDSGLGRENVPAMMAAVVVVSAPLIALFIIFKKRIMAGVARGGTKG